MKFERKWVKMMIKEGHEALPLEAYLHVAEDCWNVTRREFFLFDFNHEKLCEKEEFLK